MTNPDALERQLARVRRDGYALEDEEQAAGLRGLAAPVTGPGDEVLAAIALAAHDPRRLETEIEHVLGAARAASQALAAAAERYPLQRGIVYRLLSSYGLAAVDAYL